MPVLWKLLFKDIGRLWLLMVLGALGFMIVVQMNEIARFAALSPDPLLILRFIGYQIPYILPNAMPLAGMLASYSVFRSLSLEGELTSLRAGGYSLIRLLTPLLLFAGFLSLATLTVASEIAPRCRAWAKELLDRSASANPLALLHQKRLMRLTESWVEAEPAGPHAARHFWMVMPLGASGRLSLLHAETLALQQGIVRAGSTLLLHPRLEPETGDPELWVQSAEHFTAEASGLSPFLLRQSLQRAEDYSRWSRQWQRACAGCPLAWHELLRRCVLGVAPWVMIPMGALFGATTARFPRRLDLLIPMLMALLILAGFMAGKSLPHRLGGSLLCFCLPLACAGCATLWRFRQLEGGRAC